MVITHRESVQVNDHWDQCGCGTVGYPSERTLWASASNREKVPEAEVSRSRAIASERDHAIPASIRDFNRGYGQPAASCPGRRPCR
jgi:hypothetical protein